MSRLYSQSDIEPFLMSINHTCPLYADDLHYAPENEFHKYGLRADPSAEKATKYHGKQNNKHDEGYHANGKNEKVLRPENFREKNKFAFNHINH